MSHGFFNMISRREFEALLLGFPVLGGETVALNEATGRVLADALIAAHDWPLTDRSCMDGFAVDARDAFGASESNPAYLECVAELSVEEEPDVTLMPGECARISTGGSLPEGTDAVVMVEHTNEMEGGTVEIHKAAAPGLNVMRRGEDVRAGAPALEAGTLIRPQEIGMAAAMGFETVRVGLRPKVGIISTGDELIPVNETPRPGKVRDVNTHALAAMAEARGATCTRYGIVRDDLESLKNALERSVTENDVTLLSGGSSVGVRDFTVGAIEALPDSTLLAHGVAISPGKPAILGRVGEKAVVGLPGQVASAQVVMTVLIQPFLRHLQGDPDPFDRTTWPGLHAVMARNVASKQGREDYVRVKIEERDGEPPLAHPVLGKSGLLRTMLRAEGLAVIPAEAEGVYEGAPMRILTL
ncbi:molybdopterin molybdotransferase MoeA [Salidesulfovibrio brasiliensis]|uniref:molybdopterin molybdotransferase MoeA n=1 Tax=Salidesulfovibrio brasiliensis TaxID=221711 RepID=UPI0006D28CC5|nr:gephyrin-like molybdotransferase Glp [Salidesulfovibrio brasiliensis]